MRRLPGGAGQPLCGIASDAGAFPPSPHVHGLIAVPIHARAEAGRTGMSFYAASQATPQPSRLRAAVLAL